MSFRTFFTGKNAHSFTESVVLLSAPTSAKVIRMQQIHGNKIAEITYPFLDSNKYLQDPIPGVDACYTAEKNIFLSIKSADCLPILISGFANTVTATAENEKSFPFIAAAHAGRKSTESKILYLLLEEVNKKYNFVQFLKKKPSALHIWFGPAICTQCYQIDRKTDTHYDLISENKKQIAAFCTNHQLDPEKSLEIEIKSPCTLHNQTKYYSYRATGPGVQMNYSFIGII